MRCDFEDCPNRETLTRHLRVFDEILSEHKVLLLSDYGKGGLSHITHMISKARTAGLPILVDPKGSDYDRYKGATVITPNRTELQQVVGQWYSESELAEKAQNLRERLELKYLLLTRSEEGMTLYSDEGSLTVPTQAREVYDVSGAGDTVIAVLSTMVASGVPIEEAIRISNQAAGIVVGKLGTVPVSYAELFGDSL